MATIIGFISTFAHPFWETIFLGPTFRGDFFCRHLVSVSPFPVWSTLPKRLERVFRWIRSQDDFKTVVSEISKFWRAKRQDQGCIKFRHHGSHIKFLLANFLFVKGLADDAPSKQHAEPWFLGICVISQHKQFQKKNLQKKSKKIQNPHATRHIKFLGKTAPADSTLAL